MDKKEFDKKVSEILGGWPRKFSVLDYPVDLDLQMKYFEMSDKVSKTELNMDEIFAQKDKLNSQDVLMSEKCELLIKIAAIESPEAYHIIEDFLESAEGNLYDWGRLALQESRLLLESAYLNEPRLFISTGLGGKGNLLRYFVVLFTRDYVDIEEFQQRIIKNELEHALFKNNYEIESIVFELNFAMITTLIAFQEDIIKLFHSIINECNMFGNFLHDSCLITNVKKLNKEDIEYLIRKKIEDDKTYKL